jgi:hypothetical protein
MVVFLTHAGIFSHETVWKFQMFEKVDGPTIITRIESLASSRTLQELDADLLKCKFLLWTIIFITNFGVISVKIWNKLANSLEFGQTCRLASILVAKVNHFQFQQVMGEESELRSWSCGEPMERSSAEHICTFFMNLFPINHS